MSTRPGSAPSADRSGQEAQGLSRRRDPDAGGVRREEKAGDGALGAFFLRPLHKEARTVGCVECSVSGGFETFAIPFQPDEMCGASIGTRHMDRRTIALLACLVEPLPARPVLRGDAIRIFF